MTLDQYIAKLQEFRNNHEGSGDLPVCLGNESADTYFNEVGSNWSPELGSGGYSSSTDKSGESSNGVYVNIGD